MDETENNLIRFWAKTSDNHTKKPNAFHPLICHLVDVAVVTKKIWDGVLPTATKIRIAESFGFTHSRENFDKCGRLIAFVAGLHDLGKCSPPFALRGKNEDEAKLKAKLKKSLEKHDGKETAYIDRLHGKLQTIKFLELYKDQEFNFSGGVPEAIKAPHGYVTTVELPQILADEFRLQNTDGKSSRLAKQIGVLIGGHHGVFPSSETLNPLKDKSCVGNEFWSNSRTNLTKTLANLLKIEPIQQNAEAKLDNGTIMILAGLVSVADWIGSDKQFFECAVEDLTVEDFGLKQDFLKNYLEHAATQSETALRQLGWLDWAEQTGEKKFFELFPKLEKYPPRDLQTEAVKIAGDLKSPGIVVVEAPMGEGKTEAAMFLANCWNISLRQRGIYFALPTQATSNQMFGRVLEFLAERFDKGNVSVQLTHGKASLSKDKFLKDLKKKLEYGHESVEAGLKTLKEDSEKSVQDIYEECSGDECVPNVVAAEWFTHRKRSLLAPFGVGTIDQALMAVLQTKHVFVRLFGLAHKTIIVDEVHAYDAYMSTLLERLLEWLAALGSPVVLLSATLPVEKRNALVRAYQLGLGKIKKGAKPIVEGDDIYPRISYATDETIKVGRLETSAQNKKILHLKKIDEILLKEANRSYRIDENFVKDLKTKLKRTGGCVAIICNTVARSQEFFAALSKDEFFQEPATDGKPKLDLLHSRFRFCDREEREQGVLQRFGKPDENGESPHRPRCAVLISTQIIEQSLDLDFDSMISDLAPVDLLLQRAGRLHRHDRKNRPEEFQTPTLWIIEPKIKDDGTPNFENSIVYDQHILLRTWLELRKIEQIEIPGEIEKLIEAVYDKKDEYLGDDYQTFWRDTKLEMEKKLTIKKGKAKNCRITDADDEDLFENRVMELDEDDPEKHKTLQALTRDDEMPSVAVIILRREELKTLDIEAKPDAETIEFLLQREVKISKFGLTNEIIDSAEFKQSSWKNSPLLRHYRLLKLDERNEITVGKFIVLLDRDLGVVIEKEKKDE